MDTHTIYRMFTLENTLLILTSVRETRTPLLDSQTTTNLLTHSPFLQTRTALHLSCKTHEA